jgi:hypothetical protein
VWRGHTFGSGVFAYLSETWRILDQEWDCGVMGPDA